ncbi:hypothetical protein DLAC_05044 [Tieghemostelium lacteum]|uniref:FG-GAP repeat-containing protein n=1 Tax=Tieghemostelium lacteum TaxID=361077 RepID=A0A151ZID2_TIELA|nr:hypothetical protein DLAC_05044 [Tieghemostelium lacteum]|eukprot:KYQ93659.1 hypothetical protein DLAC_05044 [Tieghemostelium lacteum]
MRKRDVFLLLITIIIVLISLYNQSDYSLKLILEIPINTNNYENSHYPQPYEILPQPIITDLDGDGKNEILYVTNDYKIRVLDNIDPLTTSNGFNIDSNNDDQQLLQKYRIRYETSLLSKVGLSTGRRPVAMKVGFVKPYQLYSEQRSKIIAIVTSDFSLLCFDHQLRPKWETLVIEDMEKEHYISEIAITISPVNVYKEEDEGLVIVAGRIEPMEGHAHKSHLSIAIDLQEKHEIDYLEEDEQHDHNEAEEAQDAEYNHFSRDEFHFSFFAFDAKTGSKRWSHEEGDFIVENPHDKESHSKHSVRQHIFDPIDHLGEVNWRMYQDSVLDSLPHHWSSNYDTKLELKHFSRKQTNTMKQQNATSSGLSEWNSELIGVYKSNLDSLLNIFSTKDLEDSIHRKDPNVLVAHNSNGIEVIHLHSGKTLCKLLMDSTHPNRLLQEGNDHFIVYMDINGDGILDQMHSITSTNPDSNPLLFKGSQCLGLAMTGKPPRDYLYRREICDKDYASLFFNLPTSNQKKQKSSLSKLSTCPPTFIRNPETGELEVVHIVSNGMATSISPKGIENWKTDTNVQWDHTQEPYPYASVQPFSFYSQGHKSNFSKVMITLSKMNEKTTLTRLVDTYNPVLAPPVIGDLNNDGYSDIILNTLHGYKVYTIRQKSFTFDAVLLPFLSILVLLSLSVFLVYHNNSNSNITSSTNKRRFNILTPKPKNKNHQN